ncbi:MAG: carbon-nitrogen hydrolase family protein [Chloroflexota bacterium]|nr:carbon-nitrogen hydrolase family protein [Chloroflexota bacterium]
MREISVATVQMKPELGQMEDNLIKMNEFILRIATEQPVDLIVFPELITTGYEVGPRFPDLAQRIPGPTVNLIAQRASEAGVHVAFGMVSKEKVESILYNTIVLVGPDGDVVGQYHKVHLRGEEQIAFRAGFKFNAIETDFGTVGMMIGWDLAFPEAARSLTLEGAELIIVCANWEQPHTDEWRVYLLARAYENGVFLAAANRIGEEPSYTFCGQSGIVGPRGKVYASVDEPTESYAVARIDLDEVRQQREETQILQCRQPSAYRAIARKY